MRIKSIEFWRLIFAISIVLCHSMYLPTNKNGINLHVNSLAVEFFFILSGFLMARSVLTNRKSDIKAPPLGEDTIVFLKKKLKPIYIIFLISAFFELCARFLLRDASVGELVWNIWDLLFLRAFGLGYRHELLVGASWFLFAMFPAMGILYPLLKRYTNTFLYILAPLIASFILGWFAQTYGHINFALHLSKDKFICLGLLRAIAEISVGCVAYVIYEKIKNIFVINKTSSIFILLEVTSFVSVLLFAIYGTRSQTDFICILLVSLGIICSFTGKGINAFFNNVNNDFISKISQYSVCLYLNHYVWLRTLQYWKLKIPFYMELSIYIFLSAVTSLLCLYLINYVERFIEELGGKLKEI